MQAVKRRWGLGSGGRRWVERSTRACRRRLGRLPLRDRGRPLEIILSRGGVGVDGLVGVGGDGGGVGGGVGGVGDGGGGGGGGGDRVGVSVRIGGGRGGVSGVGSDEMMLVVAWCWWLLLCSCWL